MANLDVCPHCGKKINGGQSVEVQIKPRKGLKLEKLGFLIIICGLIATFIPSYNLLGVIAIILGLIVFVIGRFN